MQRAPAAVENPSPFDPFQCIGITRNFAINETALDDALIEASLRWHPDRWVQGTAQEQKQAEKNMAQINRAFGILKDPLLRAEALLTLFGAPLPTGTDKSASQGFLMEMMELKEEAESAAKNPETLSRFRTRLLTLEVQALEELRPTFESLQEDLVADTLSTVRGQLNRVQYLRRTREGLNRNILLGS